MNRNEFPCPCCGEMGNPCNCPSPYELMSKSKTGRDKKVSIKPTMETKTIKITGCKDCPLLHYDVYEYPLCGLDKQISIDKDKNYKLITPNNCPVKKNSLTIEY